MFCKFTNITMTFYDINPLNKEGNMIFKTLKEGWPRWKWLSWMTSLFEELGNDKDKLFMTLFEKPDV